MSEQAGTVSGYTDEDRELVAKAMSDAAGDDAYTTKRDAWFSESQREMYRKRARAGLDALAKAGRLLPPDAETRTDYEIDWIRWDGRIEDLYYEGASVEDMRRELAAAKSLREKHPRMGGEAKQVRRRTVHTWPDAAQLIGPWREVTGHV